MEGKRFDVIMRRLAATDSRRGAVKSLATAGLGLGFLHGQAESGKAKKKRKKRCKRLLQTCNPEGKRKCCNDLICSTRGEGFNCRKGLGEPCAESNECAGIGLCLSGKCDVLIPDL